MNRTIFISFFALFFSFSLFGKELSWAPDRIQGVLLIPRKEELVRDPKELEFKGIVTKDVSVPGSISSLSETIGPVTFGHTFTPDRAKQIEKAISSYYYQNGDPFVLVTVPKQSKTNGIIQVIVYHANIETISVVGGLKGTDQKIRRRLKIKEGDHVDYKYLDRTLFLMNRNPFRRVDLVYSPGKNPGTTDLTFNVNERRPLRFTVGANNSGVATTERQRIMAGITIGKILGSEQILAFQYTGSYDPSRFQAYTMQYVVPTPWGPTFNVYGGYSYLQTRKLFPAKSTSGKSYQGSFRLDVPVYYAQGLITECVFGFDYKAMNNTLEFSQLFSNTSNLVNLTQMKFGIKQQLQNAKIDFDCDIGIDYSPGEWISHQTDADYSALRPGAKNTWLVGRGSFHYTNRLPSGFSYYISARGQLSSENLLPSEQIGLGGAGSVRAYTERQLNYDSGFLTTFEWRSPKFPLISAVRGRIIHDRIYFLCFADGGFGHNHNILPGEPSWDYLVGVGPGIRYEMHPYIQARFDWGFKLHHESLFIGGDSMLYFDVNCNY